MNMRNHLKATNYWWAMATSASNVQRFFLQVSFSSFQINLDSRPRHISIFSEPAWLPLLQALPRGLGPPSLLSHVQGQNVSWEHFQKMFIWKCSGASRVRRHFMTATPSSRILVWSTTWSTKCSRRKDSLEFHSIRSNSYLCINSYLLIPGGIG